MAQGVREQARGLSEARRAARAAAASLLIAVAAVCQEREPPPPRSPEAVVDALLAHHHGPLRGTFEHALVELRSGPEAEPRRVLVSLPDRMRVDRAGEPIELLVQGVGWRCADGEPAVRMAADELAALQRLRHHVRALLLMPLYHAVQTRRAGPGVLSLILPGGETWRLQLDETGSRVAELRGPAGAVRFDEFLETGVTVLPKRVEIASEGVVHVRFRATDLYIDPVMFEDPHVGLAEMRTRTRPPRQRTLSDPSELPPKPELQDVPARMFLVVADPGDWQARSRAIRRTGDALAARGQAANGLPTYRLAAAGTALLVPFRPDPARGHPPFVRAAGDEVLHLESHRAVVVAPPPGPWEEVLERGRAAVRRFLTEHGLEAEGDLLCVPFLVPGTVPEPAELGRLRVRLEQRVRRD